MGKMTKRRLLDGKMGRRVNYTDLGVGNQGLHLGHWGERVALPPKRRGNGVLSKSPLVPEFCPFSFIKSQTTFSGRPELELICSPPSTKENKMVVLPPWTSTVPGDLSQTLSSVVLVHWPTLCRFSIFFRHPVISRVLGRDKPSRDGDL